MKVKSRDVGLLAVGFLLGAVLMALLKTTPARPAAAPAATFVFTGPVLAGLSPAPAAASVAVTNIQLQASPVPVVPPARRVGLDNFDSFNPGDPLYPGMPGKLHLIDMRQPGFNAGDLK